MVTMDPCSLPAVEMASLLSAGRISARELLEAHLARIDAVNPAVNALVTLTPKRPSNRQPGPTKRMPKGSRWGSSTDCRSPTRTWR